MRTTLKAQVRLSVMWLARQLGEGNGAFELIAVLSLLQEMIQCGFQDLSGELTTHSSAGQPR